MDLDGEVIKLKRQVEDLQAKAKTSIAQLPVSEVSKVIETVVASVNEALQALDEVVQRLERIEAELWPNEPPAPGPMPAQGASPPTPANDGE